MSIFDFSSYEIKIDFLSLSVHGLKDDVVETEIISD